MPLNVSLYIVPTPIGNLSDITLRAIEILNSVDSILCEDTRTSSVLLKKYDISKPLKSFHQNNEHKVYNGIIRKLKEGERMALISDAGTPGISDPGFLLVRACIEAGISIQTLPGPTAFIPALINSGFPTDQFIFLGFLPHKKGRQKALKQLANEQRTVVFYESPHRLIKLLGQIKEYVGAERKVSVSRELTKIHEETYTGTTDEVFEYFNKKEVKGEFVVVIDAKKEKE
ncbi:MAG: 16S rRNA (cytidine(1402)-2'-O)-methyltransferase [Flammeovirgaceae bacterium]|nr:16S rRNA (cytidine(1402)-2'-O)-methyltransferase [Flammeovirgaceae bacterium]